MQNLRSHRFPLLRSEYSLACFACSHDSYLPFFVFVFLFSFILLPIVFLCNVMFLANRESDLVAYIGF